MAQLVELGLKGRKFEKSSVCCDVILSMTLHPLHSTGSN